MKCIQLIELMLEGAFAHGQACKYTRDLLLPVITT